MALSDSMREKSVVFGILIPVLVLVALLNNPDLLPGGGDENRASYGLRTGLLANESRSTRLHNLKAEREDIVESLADQSRSIAKLRKQIADLENEIQRAASSLKDDLRSELVFSEEELKTQLRLNRDLRKQFAKLDVWIENLGLLVASDQGYFADSGKNGHKMDGSSGSNCGISGCVDAQDQLESSSDSAVSVRCTDFAGTSQCQITWSSGRRSWASPYSPRSGGVVDGTEFLDTLGNLICVDLYASGGIDTDYC